MQLNVTGAHTLHDLLPGAFDCGAIGTQLMLKARGSNYTFTGGDVGGKTDPDADRYNAEVNTDPHQSTITLDWLKQLTG